LSLSTDVTLSNAEGYVIAAHNSRGTVGQKTNKTVAVADQRLASYFAVQPNLLHSMCLFLIERRIFTTQSTQNDMNSSFNFFRSQQP